PALTSFSMRWILSKVNYFMLDGSGCQARAQFRRDLDAFAAGSPQTTAMVARTASLSEEDIWHVQVSDGDIPIVSLEQLDDLFRLDLIDDNVNDWQPGMPNWQPLKVIAGMDEDELKQVPPVSRPPPAPPKRMAAPDPFASTAWAPAPSFAPASFAPVTSNLSTEPIYRYPTSSGSFGKVALVLVAVVGLA